MLKLVRFSTIKLSQFTTLTFSVLQNVPLKNIYHFYLHVSASETTETKILKRQFNYLQDQGFTNDINCYTVPDKKYSVCVCVCYLYSEHVALKINPCFLCIKFSAPDYSPFSCTFPVPFLLTRLSVRWQTFDRVQGMLIQPRLHQNIQIAGSF